jgi:hypothetical protein
MCQARQSFLHTRRGSQPSKFGHIDMPKLPLPHWVTVDEGLETPGTQPTGDTEAPLGSYSAQ